MPPSQDLLQTIDTAIIPVAGLGTRVFPASLGVPKNLLPARDRPLIQHAVEEALDANCKKIVLICNPDDEPFYRRHFDANARIEKALAASGKTETLATLRKIWDYASRIIYIPQPEAMGLGHAVRLGKDYTGGKPFAVILPDDFIDAGKNTGCLRQMVDTYQSTGGKSNILAVMEVPATDIGRYGIMQVTNDDGLIARAARLVEKPKTAAEVDGSRLAIIGRYVLQPAVMDRLEHQTPGAGGEVQLTDSMAKILETQDFYGLRFKGTRYDYGTLEGRRHGEQEWKPPAP